MAGFLVIDTHEVHELAGDMRAYVETVEPRAELIVEKTAHDIEGTAQEIVAVETGFLKSTISTTVTGLDAEIGPTADYGEYVERGTSRMAAEPYMAPAFDKHEPSYVEAFGQLGDRVLR